MRLRPAVLACCALLACACDLVSGLTEYELDPSAAQGGGGLGGATSSSSGGASSGGQAGAGGEVEAGGGGAGGDPACGETMPPTMVNLGPFCIDRTEVTNAQYQAFLDSSPPTAGQPLRCVWNSDFDVATASCGGAFDPVGLANLPITCVDWCDARAYCLWAGKRLCGKIGGNANATSDWTNAAESQWFHACSQNALTSFPYGNTYDGRQCHTELGTQPDPVATHRGCAGEAPPFDAVFDLSGNVAEMEDSCDIGAQAEQDSCRQRGGSYDGTSDYVDCDGETGTGDFVQRAEKSPYIGFRCCRDP